MPTKTVPEWKRQVDQTLWSFARLHYAIAYQEACMKTLEHEPQGKEIPEELKTTYQRIEILRKRKLQISQVLDFLFPVGTDKRKFVEAYWLTLSSDNIQLRTAAVIQVLPFLGIDAIHTPTKGNRNFYYWRTSIYQELAEGFGFYFESY